MSNFGYVHLEDEVGTPPGGSLQNGSLRSINGPTITPKPQYDSIHVNNDADAGSSAPVSGSSLNNRSDNVRYTALRPTSVRELREHGAEGDNPSVLVSPPPDAIRKPISKFLVAICSLLIASVVLVIFGMILVFLIVPANQKSLPTSDTTRVPSDEAVKNYGDNVVLTSCGLVRGKQDQDVYVFRGIPYALPPTGARRWTPPVPKTSSSNTCWKGVYNATNYGSKCVQPKFTNTSDIEGSEDCLFVNVWTPSLDSNAQLPVLVWFHSGDFVYGSGHATGMSPTSQLALDTNSVYVSFNYRLGAFGFLALDELRRETDGATGNYGFMDQQMLLRWVKANIRRFGGNENLVTIFGHGSGATSVMAMLLSPGNNGLFHKAWLTSPVAIINRTVDDACRDNKSFMKRTGCSDAQCLRQLPAGTISRSSPWSLQARWSLDRLFRMPTDGQLSGNLPIVDGHMVPRHSLQSVLPTPVIFGSTYFGLSSLETEPDVVNMTWDEYDRLVDQLVSVLGPEAIAQAKTLYSHKNSSEFASSGHFPSIPGAQFTHLIGDIKDVCPTKLLVDFFIGLYAKTTPVYMYVVEVYPSLNVKLASDDRNTFMGWDVAAFFGSFDELDIKVEQVELNFQNIIREEIMSFIKSGKPDASRWHTADVNVGSIGRDVTVSPLTSEFFDKCDFWRRHGFFNYIW